MIGSSTAYTAFLSSAIDISEVSFTAIKPFQLKEPFQDASMGPFDEFDFAILQMTDSAGFRSEIPVSSTSLDVLERLFLPQLFNARGLNYRELYNHLYWSMRNEGFRSPHVAAPLGSLDILLHDLAARRAGMPFHRFLGASRDCCKVYICGGGTNRNPGQLLEECESLHDRGFDTFKIKIGKTRGTRVDEDISRVQGLYASMHAGMKLAVDANQVYTFETASRFLDGVRELELAWIEEPVHSADLVLLRQICRRAKESAAWVPAFSAGESELSARVFPSLVEAGITHLQPIPGWLAGVSQWMDVRDLARANDLALSSGSFSHLSCEFVTTAGEEAKTELLQSIIGEMDRFYLKAPRLEKGKFHLDDSPGLTLAFNHELLEKDGHISFSRQFTKKDFSGFKMRVI